MGRGAVQELQIERTRQRGIVGNIYLAKVVRVLPGMQSAFIDVGLERTAFMHVADITQNNPQAQIEKLLFEGQNVLVQVLKDLEAGKGTEADLDKLLDLCDNIMGRSFCALGDGATSPITSSIKYFRDEYIAHLTQGGCPFDPVASTLFAGAGA